MGGLVHTTNHEPWEDQPVVERMLSVHFSLHEQSDETLAAIHQLQSQQNLPNLRHQILTDRPAMLKSLFREYEHLIGNAYLQNASRRVRANYLLAIAGFTAISNPLDDALWEKTYEHAEHEVLKKMATVNGEPQDVAMFIDSLNRLYHAYRIPNLSRNSGEFAFNPSFTCDLFRANGIAVQPETFNRLKQSRRFKAYKTITLSADALEHATVIAKNSRITQGSSVSLPNKVCKCYILDWHAEKSQKEVEANCLAERQEDQHDMHGAA